MARTYDGRVTGVDRRAKRRAQYPAAVGMMGKGPEHLRENEADGPRSSRPPTGSLPPRVTDLHPLRFFAVRTLHEHRHGLVVRVGKGVFAAHLADGSARVERLHPRRHLL